MYQHMECISIYWPLSYPWIYILIDKVDRWIETGQVFGKENQLKCRNNYVLANI